MSGCYSVELTEHGTVIRGPDGEVIAEGPPLKKGQMIRYEAQSSGVKCYLHRSDGKGGVERVEIGSGEQNGDR